MMEDQHAPSDSFEVFHTTSFIPYVIYFVLLCLAFGSMYLNSFDSCERIPVLTTTTTTARPKESPRLSAGKKEISTLKVDLVHDRERFESFWCQEDVAACAQEDDARDVRSDEEETSEGGSEREIEEMEDEVSDSNDEDVEYDEEDYDDNGDDDEEDRVDNDDEDDEKHYDDNEDDDGDDNDDADEDDGWEVLERRQLRREYERAVRFVESQKNDEGMSKFSDDEKLRFYGLHKVAVEGPCQEPQPAPFNLSARTKWNAWRQLGFMNPDDAVEQYIDLLQEKFPNWRKDSLVVSTAGDRDPKRRRIIVEARSESSHHTVDHDRSQARIGSICSLLSFIKLVMNKLGQISFRHTNMSGEGSQSSESAVRRP